MQARRVHWRLQLGLSQHPQRFCRRKGWVILPALLDLYYG
jgi:hypothetical protein